MLCNAQRGLTLVELLVALMVFAFVSAAAVGVMHQAGQGEARLKEVTATLAELERARALLRQDLLQIAARPYRDPGSTALMPAMLGGERARARFEEEEGEVLLMAFVRRGWSNPGAAKPRASLQHVTYLVRDDTLIRRTRPFLDAVHQTPVTEQILFEEVRNVRIAFLLGTRWRSDWQSAQGETAPWAVRLEMTHPVYGDLVQDFLAGEGR